MNVWTSSATNVPVSIPANPKEAANSLQKFGNNTRGINTSLGYEGKYTPGSSDKTSIINKINETGNNYVDIDTNGQIQLYQNNASSNYSHYAASFRTAQQHQTATAVNYDTYPIYENQIRRSESPIYTNTIHLETGNLYSNIPTISSQSVNYINMHVSILQL